ncbi:MAG: PEGA domain-containing protein [Polyangiaceae bacterium]|nr:PEGA domain-containing protein [Polyangiaceae bacterium]
MTPARGAWVALSLLCSAGPSRAAPDPDQALFDAAVEDERRDRWMAARQKLLALVARHETAGVRFHLGHAAERLGHPCLAIGEFERAATLAAADPELRGRAESRAALARAATSRITVATSPASAAVSIDDVSASGTTCVTPGTHSVRATAPGYLPASRTVEAQAGETARASITLAPSAPPTPVGATTPARDDTARWLVLGAAGALAVASGALWLEQQRLLREASRCGAGCDRAAREEAAARTGRGALATGAAALVGGGVFVAWTVTR